MIWKNMTLSFLGLKRKPSMKQTARRAALLAACFILELHVSRYYCILKSSIHILIPCLFLLSVTAEILFNESLGEQLFSH
jgi:hypothetical protein